MNPLRIHFFVSFAHSQGRAFRFQAARTLTARRWDAHSRDILLVIALLAVTCSLYAPGMTARLPMLDESAYLHRGALLRERSQLHPLADNPTPTLVNGALYEAFKPDRIHLEDVSTMRRWLTLSLLVLGAFFAALSCGMPRRFAAAAALLTGTSPALGFVLNNSSDACYAVFLIFVFGWAAGEVKRIKRSRPRSPMQYALFGLLLSGLSLSRNDGFVVTPFALLFLAVALKRTGFSSSGAAVRLSLAGAAFCAPVALWCVMAGLQTGDWGTHLPERSYTAFSQGQNILFAGQFIDSPNTPTAESTFGSAAHNHNSILQALWHHPRASFRRLRRLPANVSQSVLTAYGGKAECFVTLAFLAIGIAMLASRRSKAALLLGGVCLLPLAVYPLTFFRPGYFAMNYPVLCTLSLSGIACGISGGNFSRGARAVLVLLPALVLLNCLQVLRGGAHRIAAQKTQNTLKRHWVVELQKRLPTDTPVIALDPSLLWYAHLVQSNDPDLFMRLTSGAQLANYMQEHRLYYLVLDQDVRHKYPRFAGVVEASNLTPVFRDEVYGAILYRTPKQ